DEFDQGSAVLASQASADIHLRGRERREIVELEGIAGGARIAFQRDAEGAGSADDLELAGRARIDRERGPQYERRETPGRAAELLRCLRSESVQGRRHPVEAARI